MAGYPGHPLPKKLGIKAGHTVCLLNAPGTFERTLYASIDVSSEARITHDLRLPLVDMIVLFVESTEELERRFSDVVGRLHPAGGLWVAYRNNSRRICEDVVRRVALAGGMAANKAIAVDSSHDGVRLVMRPEIREAMAYRVEPPPVLSRIGRRTRRPTARIAPRVARASSSGAGSSLRRARASRTR
jgi:hypothetical protein